MFQSFIWKNRLDYSLVPIYFSRKISGCSIIFFNGFSMFQSFIWNNIIPIVDLVTFHSNKYLTVEGVKIGSGI